VGYQILRPLSRAYAGLAKALSWGLIYVEINKAGFSGSLCGTTEQLAEKLFRVGSVENKIAYKRPQNVRWDFGRHFLSPKIAPSGGKRVFPQVV
jgi:hypothetical protein